MAFLATFWILSGVLTHDERSEAKAPLRDQAARDSLRVRAALSLAEPHKEEVVLRGRTEADRKVTLRAETMGTVVRVPKERGSFIKKGDPLCILSKDARMETQKAAEAMMDLRHIQMEASEKLAQQGHRARTGLARARADYETAKMQLRMAQMDLDHATIDAPFDAFLNDTHVEEGDSMNIGTACATLIDMDPLLMIGELSEDNLAHVKKGMSAYAILKDGRQIEGHVSYLSGEADTRTRTFTIRLTSDEVLENIREGMTVEIHIPGKEVLAHSIPPSILTLNDLGEIGLRIVEDGNVSRFRKVNIIASAGERIWVTGLPEKALIITAGQEYAGEGAIVHVLREDPKTRKVKNLTPMGDSPIEGTGS